MLVLQDYSSAAPKTPPNRCKSWTCRRCSRCGGLPRHGAPRAARCTSWSTMPASLPCQRCVTLTLQGCEIVPKWLALHKAMHAPLCATSSSTWRSADACVTVSIGYAAPCRHGRQRGTGLRRTWAPTTWPTSSSRCCCCLACAWRRIRCDALYFALSAAMLCARASRCAEWHALSAQRRSCLSSSLPRPSS